MERLRKLHHRNTAFVILFIFGIILGFFIGKNDTFNKDIKTLTSKEIRLGGFKYINPLLECDNNQIVGEQEYRPSRQKVLDMIDTEKKNGIIIDTAVYYRDLNNGPWFGINETSKFSPASLLKLPVMMAYFKKAETDPFILAEKLKFVRKQKVVQPFFSSQEVLKDGESYTIEDLIKAMIINSSNEALFLLQDNINPNLIDKLTADLGIEPVPDTVIDNFMSVKSYTSLFRILYNASYLSIEFSQKALEILDKATFNEGIVKGVPSDIVISHKYGERELEDGVKQLHDCGIVYYPKHPYLLCIMTRGKDYKQLSQIIQKISSEVYADINSKFKLHD